MKSLMQSLLVYITSLRDPHVLCRNLLSCSKFGLEETACPVRSEGRELGTEAAKNKDVLVNC